MYTVLPAPLGPSACTLTVCIVALLYLTNGPEAQAVELARAVGVQLLLAATLSPADPRRRLSDPAPGAGTLMLAAVSHIRSRQPQRLTLPQTHAVADS